MSTLPLAAFSASCTLASSFVEVVLLEIGRAVDPERTCWLSAEERDRANRFAFERDRSRYVNARAALRQILAACLGTHPGDVTFSHGPCGKPALAAPQEPLRFNLSHSGDRALVALALGREVGVDLEQIREDIDHLGIARSYFTEREARELESAPAEERSSAFFRRWAAKESYVKARGDGLSAPLDAFELQDDGPEAFHLRWSRLDHPGRSWRVVPLEAGEGWAAALTCEGTGWTVRRWRGVEDAARR